MLVRVGSCEAEVKVAALMSTPRLGFTDNFFTVSAALAPHKIAPIKYTGAYWAQCVQRTMQQVVDDHDVVLTIDYDSIFTARTVEALITLLMFSGYDAIAPLQTKRESNAVMFSPLGVDEHKTTSVDNDWFDKPVQPAGTAHFGCTVIRTEAIKRMPKPWFLAKANEQGEYTGGHTDEDTYFWRNFTESGNKLGIASNIAIGHAELMITWPSRSTPNGCVQQHTTQYWNDGQKPPEEAWGIVK